PGVKRTAFAEEAGTTIVAVGGVPEKAFVPVGWEIWRPLHPLYESGRYAEVIDRGREQIEAAPAPQPLYNLACRESLTRQASEAIERLRLALDLTEPYRERLRELATNDSDFDPIRDEPAFRDLIGPPVE